MPLMCMLALPRPIKIDFTNQLLILVFATWLYFDLQRERTAAFSEELEPYYFALTLRFAAFAALAFSAFALAFSGSATAAHKRFTEGALILKCSAV